jgi:hypothetical protein
MGVHQRDKLLPLVRFTWQIWSIRSIQWPREYAYGEWYVIIRLSVTPPHKLDISKMLKWYWHHSNFVSVKCHFYTQQNICMFNSIISMHCIQFNVYRRRYIWKYTIPSQIIHCRKQYEKRKNETWIDSESFECTREGQNNTGAPYWRSYRTIIAKSYPLDI